MKKLISLLLSMLLVLSLCLPVSAAHVSATEAISTLETLNLVRGTGNGFEPERAATRAEAVVMLLRLLGQETAAESARRASPFTDGGWADGYLGYAYEQGLVKGMSATLFGSDNTVSARDYATMALRALGYTEGADFTWADSLAFSDAIGLTHGEYGGDADFLREDMALISYTALTLKLKGSGQRLIEALYSRGAVSPDALKQTRFADAVNTGRTVYTAEEIHEMVSSAVLYMDLFQTEEELQKGTPSGQGSGFLISPDGLAVLNWHELDGKAYANAITTEGRAFPVERVLYYDVFWDAAVVRLSMTDTDGQTVRFFPYLDLGDSDAISTGEPVYTVSNPLGLTDTVTSGLVSHPNRDVDDPDYPAIQITAPMASGSSGGPLLNRYGEVIGILFGSYIRGENMNLAVPINSIRGADLSAAGITIAEMLELEQAKKDAAVLTAGETKITLAAGETKDVVIRSDFPGSMSIRYEIDDTSVVGCTWGRFVTKQSVILTVAGREAGSTEVHITFYEEGNPDAELTLRVTVTE